MKIICSILLCFGMLNVSFGQDIQDLWICDESNAEIVCDQDSLIWMALQDGLAVPLDSVFSSFDLQDDVLMLPDFDVSNDLDTLFAYSIAAVDSGDVACQFVLHHFTLDSSISILVTPEEASPFCFGSDVSVVTDLPLLPDSALSWNLDWLVLNANEDVVQAFGDSTVFQWSLMESVSLNLLGSIVGAQCPTAESTTDLAVFSMVEAPVISVPEDSLCSDNTGITMVVEWPASGGDELFNYEWQQLSPGSENWEFFASGTAISTAVLSPGTHAFRALANSSCGTALSNEVQIIVLPAFVGPELVSNASSMNGVCSGLTADSFLWTVPPSGGVGEYVIVWNAILLSGDTLATQSSESPFVVNENLTESFQVNLFSEDAFGCGSTFSSLDVTVYQPIVAPAIDLISSDTLCSLNAGLQLVVVDPPLGGANTNITEWLISNSTTGEEITLPSNGVDPLLLNSLLESSTIVLVNENGCGGSESNEISIEVLPPFQGAGILENTSLSEGICYGNESDIFEWTQAPSGGVGSYTILWQLQNEQGEVLESQLDGDVFDVASTPLSDFTISLQIEDDFGCGSSYDFMDLTVYAALVAPVLSSLYQDTLCAVNEGLHVAIAQSFSGGAPNNESSWIFSDTDGSQSTISDGVSPFTLTSLEESAVVWLLNQNSCGAVTSNEMVFEVLPAFQGAGIIENASFAAGICYGASADVFEWTQEPTGGVGSYAVLWQLENTQGEVLESQSSSGTFDVGDTPLSDFAISLLIEDSFGCGSSYDALELTVYGSMVAPVLTSLFPDTLCAMNDGIHVSIDQGYTGGAPDNESMWIFSDESGGVASNSDGVSSFILMSLEQSAVVWLLNQNSCGSVVSNVMEFEVLPPLISPVVSMDDSDFPLCFGQDAPVISIEQWPEGGNEIWISSWNQEFESGITSQGSELLAIELGPQSDSSFVQLVAESGFGCGTVSSNLLQIDVLDELQPGVLQGEQLICYNTAPELIEASLASGGSNEFDMFWYITDSEGTQEMGTSSLYYQFSSLTDSITVFLGYEDVYGCGGVQTNPIAINVLPNLEQPGLVPSTEFTLCWMEGISIGSNDFILYDWLSYHWGFDETEMESVTGAQTPMIAVEGLMESASFVLEITSEFGCGSVLSDTLEVAVFPNLQPGVIAASDEEALIDPTCFGDSLSWIVNQQFPFGGSGQMAIEWMVLSEQGEVLSELVANDTLEFGAVFQSVSVLRIASDLLGCGVVSSNILDFPVYEELTWQVELSNVMICDDEDLSVVIVSASGGGDAFSFDWMGSDSMIAWSEVNAPNLSGIYPDSTFSLSVEAVSLNACGSLFSDTVDIIVAEPLMNPVIMSSESEICSGESVTISTTIPAQGGFGEFDVSWWQWSTDDVFVDSGEMGSSISIIGDDIDIVVYQNGINDCGAIQSDSLIILVNPLPSLATLDGVFAPCLLSSNHPYSLSSGWWIGLDYNWSIEGGVIQSGETGPDILVNWGDGEVDWSLAVSLVDTITGCAINQSWNITPSEESAPPLSQVVKKNGLDILVSSDSTDCATYQWGRQNIEDNQVEFFEGFDEQYALFQPLDTINYYYFVDIAYTCSGFGDCSTRNFYNYSVTIGIELPDYNPMLLKVYPNPSDGIINVQGIPIGVPWKLYSMQGVLVASGTLSDQRIRLPLLERGVYFFQELKTNQCVKIERF